jgi:hypothetical protein
MIEPDAKGPAAHRWPGKRPRRAVGSILIVAGALLGADGASACEVPQGFQRLATPEAEIAYRWEPSELKVGRFFAAEVIACRPAAVREIVLDAQMPAHGHGMNYRPAVEQTRPGSFRFTGLMLHMAGIWRVTFDLIEGAKRTRLTREVTLKP